MDKNTLYPLVSLVLAILAAGSIYMLAGAFGGTEPHGGEHEGDHGDAMVAEELFFEAIRSPLQYSEYTYAYEDVASNGYTSSVFLTSSANYSYVRKDDAIFTRELFVSGNSTILCLENVNRRLCSEVSQNSTFGPYAYSLETLLFNRETIEKTEENNEKLVQYGAIVFGEEVTDSSYNGRECSEISYTLDYSKLTVEQMWDLGLSPDSPEVLISKQFNFTLCIDPDSGDVLHRLLSYYALGEPHSTESSTVQILWGTPSAVEFPSELGSGEEMDTFLSALSMSQYNYRVCLAQEEVDGCIRTEAILSRNERLCELVQNSTMRDICYVNVGLEKGNSLLCEEVGAGNRDACFMEFAWKYNNASFCESVSAGAKQECFELVSADSGEDANATLPAEPGEQEAPPEGENGGEAPPEQGEFGYGSECATDSECVRAGCSSQLCVPSYWSDIATTCEYSEEYNCLPLSSCGCHDGKCAWDQNQEYLDCLKSPPSVLMEAE